MGLLLIESPASFKHKATCSNWRSCIESRGEIELLVIFRHERKHAVTGFS